MIGRFVIFLIVFQAIITSLHWLPYKAVSLGLPDFFERSSGSLLVSLGLLSVMFTLASVVTFRYNAYPMRLFYALAASWMGIFVYVFFAACIFLLAYPVVMSNWGLVGAQNLFFLLLFLILVISIYGFINARVIRTTEVSVSLPNMPQAWVGRQAVLVSDIHLGHILDDGFIAKVVKHIAGLEPDIVFVAGDLFDGVPADFKKLGSYFNRLNSPLGVYFVPGNHDEMLGAGKALEGIENSGMVVLENKKVVIDNVQIIGLDFKAASGRGNTKILLNAIGIDQNKPSILVKHTPLNVEDARQSGIDLQLSGHTHKGQLYPLGYIASMVHNGFVYGLKNAGDMKVVVSSGVGTWGPPMRVGTKSEVVLITFK